MADVDIDPFGEHNKTESKADEPTEERVDLPEIPRGAT